MNSLPLPARRFALAGGEGKGCGWGHYNQCETINVPDFISLPDFMR
jgi:hypothetical protein